MQYQSLSKYIDRQTIFRLCDKLHKNRTYFECLGVKVCRQLLPCNDLIGIPQGQ